MNQICHPTRATRWRAPSVGCPAPRRDQFADSIVRDERQRFHREADRILARSFGFDESRLGGCEYRDLGDSLVVFARRPVRSAALDGALNAEESADGHFAFDPRWLRRLTGVSADKFSLIRVEGDSMSPTLKAGDDILLDDRDAGARLRDGIYVLRIEDALVVKRLSILPFDRRITIQSDNPAYPDRRLEEIDVVGRVLSRGAALTDGVRRHSWLPVP